MRTHSSYHSIVHEADRLDLARGSGGGAWGVHGATLRSSYQRHSIATGEIHRRSCSTNIIHNLQSCVTVVSCTSVQYLHYQLCIRVSLFESSKDFFSLSGHGSNSYTRAAAILRSGGETDKGRLELYSRRVSNRCRKLMCNAICKPERFSETSFAYD